MFGKREVDEARPGWDKSEAVIESFHPAPLRK